MKRRFHLCEAPAESCGHSGKACHTRRHERLKAIFPDALQNIIGRGKNGHVSEVHHGHIQTLLQKCLYLPRGGLVALLAKGGLVRHGKAERQDFLLPKIQRALRNVQRQHLARFCLRRGNHRAPL